MDVACGDGRRDVPSATGTRGCSGGGVRCKDTSVVAVCVGQQEEGGVRRLDRLVQHESIRTVGVRWIQQFIRSSSDIFRDTGLNDGPTTRHSLEMKNHVVAVRGT